MKSVITLILPLTLVACGKFEGRVIPSQSTADVKSEIPASSTSTKSEPSAAVATAAKNGDPAKCTAYSTSDQDARALAEIAQLNKVQCLLKAKILGEFYSATKDMTDEDRRAFFQRQIAGLNPPPPPPPAPCSVIVKALLDCAKG